MFVNAWEETSTGRALIEDTQPETLEALLTFVNTDVVKEDDITAELLALADRYQIQELVRKCEYDLILDLTVESADICDKAVDCFLVGYLHQAESLKKAAKKYMLRL